MENASTAALEALLAETREFIQQARSDGASNTAMREEKKAKIIERELSRRSLAAYYHDPVAEAKIAARVTVWAD